MSARRDVAAAAAFVAAMLVFVYGIVDPDAAPDTRAASAVIVGALAVVHFATGLVGGRWWLVMLPLIAVLLAVPAGLPETTQGEPLPIWFGLALLEPIGIALLAAGIAVHKLVRRRAAG